MAYISARQCDRCKRIDENQPGDIDSTTGWAELKFTYDPTRWHICPNCVGDYAKFIRNEAVLPVKIIRRES